MGPLNPSTLAGCSQWPAKAPGLPVAEGQCSERGRSPSLACCPKRGTWWTRVESKLLDSNGLGLILLGASSVLCDPYKFPFQNVCKSPGQGKTRGSLLTRRELCHPSPVHCPLMFKEKESFFQRKLSLVCGCLDTGETRSCLRQPRPSLNPVSDAADNSALSEKFLAGPSFGLIIHAISGWTETKGSVQEIHLEQHMSQKMEEEGFRWISV